MLVLLAIVLTTATFIAKGSIKIDLPKASSQASQYQKSTEITITESGDVYISERKIVIEELIEALAQTSKENVIVINGDQNMDYKHFVSVIDTLTLGGYTNLSITTKKK